jgi:DNA modification methylase
VNCCFIGDCRDSMREMISQGVKVQMCVTSPPYWGLRDYGVPEQLGLESTPDEYVSHMVDVFRLVRDLLADDGTLWLNLGDSYSAPNGRSGGGTYERGPNSQLAHMHEAQERGIVRDFRLAAKQLIGIPWRVAFALQADGWYLRQDIIWHKPNPMPESVRDRCTKAHEYIFLLSKRERYYFDAEAIAEPLAYSSVERLSQPNLENQEGRGGKLTGGAYAPPGQAPHGNARMKPYTGQATKDFDAAGAQDASATKARIVDAIIAGDITTRNKRSVWTVTTKPYAEAHFATFPPHLIEPCILAGSRPNDTVLDPFFGSGTTGEVAQRLGRQWIGCELNPAYEPLQAKAYGSAGIDADVKARPIRTDSKVNEMLLRAERK